MKISTYLTSLLIAAALLLPALAGIYSEYLWFVEVGYTSVFLTVLKTKLAVGAIAAIFFFVLSYLNTRIAFGNAMKARSEEEFGFTGISIFVVLVLALLAGYASSLSYETVLRYLNQIPFNAAEPVFGNDVSFYVFSLPFYQFVWRVLFYGLAVVVLLVSGIYLVFGGAFVAQKEEYGQMGISVEFPKIPKEALSHLYALGAGILVLAGAGYYLDRYQILYSMRGAAYGAGYTDLAVQLPLLGASVALALVAAIGFIISARSQNSKYAILGLALLLSASLIGSLTAGLVQQYKVAPDEYNIEKPYIERSIQFTRAAYALDTIKEVEFPAKYNLTIQDINRNNQTIENVRLWDWQPLMRTYKQVQLLRTYYDFYDVDIDRYYINGEYRQVMISAREMNVELLPDRTWINEHMRYTHGYGVAMSPVREVSREGLPALYVRDIPPKSEYFNIAQPEVYYGELTKNYVLVKTKTEEFDYPRSEGDVYTSYTGNGGIPISSPMTRAVMAARFGTLSILVSASITEESRILFYRTVSERVNAAAPFLRYDSDPYIALSNGRLYWILDAYTVSNRYPYAEPSEKINYIRNSVKVVIDAYDGTLDFYVVEEEPLIKNYVKIFPSLFKPLSQMPEDLKRHIRYPEDLFHTQLEKYAVYHMTDTKAFYGKEDVWEVPQELYEGTRIKMEPYYLITKLPGETKEEFIILLPFVPKTKNNMIAWFAARSDLARYGERIVYVFPKDRLVYGPIQIEARIDQDPEISQLFALWSQGGTRVIRGNLLAIPIEDSLLYVEPIYLRAEQKDALPELKRVIVAFGDRLTMQETLEKSIAAIFGMVQVIEPAAARMEEKSAAQRADEALEHYAKAQVYLKQGNWSGYGSELAELERVLQELKEKWR